MSDVSDLGIGGGMGGGGGGLVGQLADDELGEECLPSAGGDHLPKRELRGRGGGRLSLALGLGLGGLLEAEGQGGLDVLHVHTVEREDQCRGQKFIPPRC